MTGQPVQCGYVGMVAAELRRQLRILSYEVDGVLPEWTPWKRSICTANSSKGRSYTEVGQTERSGSAHLAGNPSDTEPYLRAKERNKRLDHVKRCMDKVNIDGVWFVDCSLPDQTGTQNFEKEGYPAIIAVAEELRTLIGKGRTLCVGPYWGLNLLLWARGITSLEKL